MAAVFPHITATQWTNPATGLLTPSMAITVTLQSSPPSGFPISARTYAVAKALAGALTTSPPTNAQAASVFRVYGPLRGLPVPIHPETSVFRLYRCPVGVPNADLNENLCSLVRGVWDFPVSRLPGVVFLDQEAPLDQEFFYSLRYTSDPASPGAPPYGYEASPNLKPPVVSGTCVPTIISDPSQTDMWLQVGLMAIDKLEHPRLSTEHQIPWRRDPVHISGTPPEFSTSFTVLTETPEQRAKLLQIMAYAEQVQVRISAAGYPESGRYYRFTSISEERFIPDVRDPRRKWSLDAQCVAPPTPYTRVGDHLGYYDLPFHATSNAVVLHHPSFASVPYI
jgi:hypothetical protein